MTNFMEKIKNNFLSVTALLFLIVTLILECLPNAVGVNTSLTPDTDTTYYYPYYSFDAYGGGTIYPLITFIFTILAIVAVFISIMSEKKWFLLLGSVFLLTTIITTLAMLPHAVVNGLFVTILVFNSLTTLILIGDFINRIRESKRA